MPLPRRKVSDMWEHFDEVNSKGVAKCKYCSSIIKTTGGSMGNLKRHLGRKHPTVNLLIERKSSVVVQEIRDDIQDEIIAESTEEMPGPSNPVKKPIKKDTQSKLEEYVSKPISSKKSRSFDIQLLRMVVKEYQPFSLVDDVEFKKFVSMLNPGYSLPTRKTLSNNLLSQLYQSELEKVKQKLKNINAVCLTTDTWTSSTTESYLSVTAHFFENNLQLTSVLLECIKMEDRHTGENYSRHLKEIVGNYGLEDNVAACTTDNAANVTLAVKLCNWQHIPCFAHTLNLIVKNAVTEISETVDKVKSIVTYFKKSTVATSQLQVFQEQMDLPKLKLKQEVCTRWNSLYEMFSRIFEIKNAVISALAVLGTDYTLSADDWYTIEKVIAILKIYLDVTTEISAEKYVTISKIIPIVKMMRKKMNSLSVDNESEQIKQMILKLKSGLNERFKNIEDNEIYCQSTILDPRFKKYGFVDEVKFKRACEIMKKKLQSFRISDEIDNQNQIPSTSQNSQPIVANKDFWDDFDEEVKTVCAYDYNPQAAAIIELDRYLKEPLLLRTMDPLKWWNERSNIYPRLFHLVKRRLCLVATSVPSERIFSKSGYVITERRNRITSKKVREIMFLNHNL
ncbi:E3 SUMO-protein ligase ZBED1-like [Diabrotica undecimpunctata]|uniref:E3 SUMO-protein ligase ZBED1-like n=1 Tax=Diabrotica undecimpunctata TaxID=50387 RepID=UPI003B63D920